ncbi:MAG TPA: NAD-dependent epimerase/dehydratase family protein [Casimicrobiaceae bacterium]
MRLLVLGGTRFLGRHLVEAALARGDDVTIFTRGRSPVPWPDRVSALGGDRDPRIAPGLAALAHGTWDAAIDCSGYVPRIVEAGARLLASRVSRYVFVSSLSVYAKTDRPNLDEATPLAALADPATEQVPEHYGALKAACEAAVERNFGSRATHVRPGLVVGPFDATDRFGYWVARFVHPHLLGERPPRAVVPEPPERPLQFIDARDLAKWMLDLAARDVAGPFNACSPAWQWRMSGLVKALRAAAPSAPRPAWIEEERLVAAGVTPWIGLPLWLPANDADSAGFMTMDCTRALEAGLATRPLPETIHDTAEWLVRRDNAGAWQHVLSADAERALLAL